MFFRPLRRLSPYQVLTLLVIFSYGNDEPEEGFYEEEDPDDELPPDVDLDEDALEDRARDQGDELEDKNIVTSGDPNQTGQKPASETDRKIDDDKRSTTPYMTKYERARVLGTRALQLR